MGRDLFAEPTGRDLFAGPSTAGRDLLAPKEKGLLDKTGDFLDYLGDLTKNSPGLIPGPTPELLGNLPPSEPLEQLSIGAAGTARALERAFYEQPDAFALREDPEVQARIAELKQKRAADLKRVQEIQAKDNPVAKLTGNALQSLPAATVGLAAAPFLPEAGAVAVGLGSNFLVEGSSEFEHRLDDFNQDRDKAWAGAGRHAVVATGLEMVPMTAAAKYIKKGTPGATAMAKIGVGEAVQEGTTQLFDDLSTNAEGLTKFTPKQIAVNAGEAAATGLIMGHMMVPLAKGAQVAQRRLDQWKVERAEARHEKAFNEVVAELETSLQGQFEESPLSAELPIITEEMTSQEKALAAVQKAQLLRGETIPVDEAGAAYGMGLRLSMAPTGLGQGRTTPEEDSFADAVGMSQEVLARRERTKSSEELPIDQRPITLMTTDQRVYGLTLQQTGELPAGAVVGVGFDPELFPAEVYQPVADTLASWVRKYMPEAKIVLNMEQLPDGAFGNHVATLSPTTGEYTHVITPRELPSWKYSGGDVKTRMSMITALSHEFGHALKVQNFMKGLAGLGGERMTRVQDMLRTGDMDEGLLAEMAQVAPEEAALVQRWAQLRNDVLAGKLMAKDFVDQWVGTRKLGDSVSPLKKAENKSLYSWAEDVAKRAGKNLEGMTAQEFVELVYPEGAAYALNFDEFMAEQFSRAAYASGALGKSPLGKFFASTMAQLRDLFRSLKSWRGEKGERIIQPDETFQTWLEKQTLRAKGEKRRSGKFKLPKAVRSFQKQVKERVQAAPKPAPAPMEIAEANLGEKDTLTAMADELFVQGRLTEKQLDRYLDKITRGELVAVRESLQRFLSTDVNWEREYASKVLSRLPDKVKLKAETLRATLAMQDIKAREREFWQKFLEEHPEGFSIEEAREALGALVMPLQAVHTSEYASLGSFVLGTSLDPTEAGKARYTTRIWTNPEVSNTTRNHFRRKDYLMHSRYADTKEGRWVLELQSDLFQKPSWRAGESMSPETVARIEDEIENVAYTRDAVRYLDELYQQQDEEELVREWDLVKFTLPEEYQRVGLEGLESFPQVREQLEQTLQELAQRAQSLRDFLTKGQIKAGAIAQKLEDISRSWWERLIREEVAQAVEDTVGTLYFPTADTVAQIEGWEQGEDGSWGERQGIYNRYLNDVAKFLKKEYQAEEVDRNGVGWLKVGLQDKSSVVQYWDRENPLQPSSPSFTLSDVAGLTPEEYRKPEVVAQAAQMWATRGFESPFWKRWGGETKVVGLDGKPLEVFRGAGGRVDFLNKWGRGGHTGADSAKKAFWFSDNHANAQWYAASAAQGGKALLQGEARRELSNAQKKLQEAVALRDTIAAGDPAWGVIQKRVERLRREVENLRGQHDTQPVQPVVQGYYLNIQNPLVVDMEGRVYTDKEYTRLLDNALAAGHDGVVFKNTYDPLEGTMYAVFEPEQAKLTANVGTFDPTDELHWDAESPGQQAARKVSKLLQKFWGKEKLTAGNIYAKAVDAVTQLQQAAASQPEDFALQLFMQKGLKAEQLKNKLQRPAEELVKEMSQLLGAGRERVQALHRVLKAEWKSGRLQTGLEGLDSEGNVVWGEEVGVGLAQQAQVTTWRVKDSVSLREFFKKNGVDVTTEEGGKVLDLYMKTRNLFLYHFNELGKTLKTKVARQYQGAPALQKQELLAINSLMSKLLLSPFVPQGNFGKYVLSVKQRVPGEDGGRAQWKVIYRKHFEREADWQQAELEARQRAKGDLTLEVSTRVLEDQTGLPMQLPQDLLHRLADTGEFSEEQLEVLSDVLSVSKYDRIAEKFAGISRQVEGGNEDFARVLADFAGRNANYIWKSQYRFEMQQVISAAKHQVRRMEKNPLEDPKTLQEKVHRQRRNIGMMQKALDYITSPPNELQGMRGFISLVYLAYNVKTALMNVSTQLNTLAAAGTEYGEVAGLKEVTASYKQIGELLLYKSAVDKGETGRTLQGVEMNELVGVLDRAIQDGTVDQSYAYFLAATANANPLLAATGGRASRLAHAIGELGMLPFQTLEKLNRVHSLITFYKLERKVGKAGVEKAYQRAVAKTNLLQNSYSPINRPEVFRGKKAILTMFMSYTQFMGWITTGGYERGARAQAQALGREVAPVWRGTTAKLWLIYLMLGGLMGVPFARNLLDLVQWVWRKLTGGNMEAELRGFMEELGVDSNFAMHGLMHDLGGFDLSASFGLGRMLPGTDLLTKEKETTTLETIGSLVTAGSGPAGNFYKSVLEAVGYLGDGEGLEAGKSMPGAIGAVSRATDAYLRQAMRPTFGVTTKSGLRLTWDEEKQEFRDLTTRELAGMALGVNPTILAENREKHYAMRSEIYYWQTRRSDLLDRHWQAYRSGDMELREEVLKEIRRFGEQVPDRKLRITGKDLSASRKSHQKQLNAGERYGAEQKKYRGVAQEVAEGY